MFFVCGHLLLICTWAGSGLSSESRTSLLPLQAQVGEDPAVATPRAGFGGRTRETMPEGSRRARVWGVVHETEREREREREGERKRERERGLEKERTKGWG
jgi:hypothetical protein